jgi:acetyl esterase/lipase
MTVTTTEVLLDDTLLFATRAARAGVSTTLHVLPNLFHMWYLWPEVLPEARQTVEDFAHHLA